MLPYPDSAILLFGFAALFDVAICGTADEIAPDSEKLGWYSAPNYRSTFDLLWTCLLTIVLCCWTAIHPDVPGPGSSVHQWIDRSICLMIGMMAPEIFVYFSFFERMYAHHQLKEAPPGVGGDKWSVTHKFYAVMGGFCVRWKNQDGSESDELAYLDPAEVHFLLRNRWVNVDSFPTVEEIRDKGKADGILKAFTLLQVLWLVIQSIARTIQHLPLSTLEVSTLAYIPCAISIVALWWHKPYDVGVPTTLTITPRPYDGERHTIVVKPYRKYRMTRSCWDEAIASAVTPINRSGALSTAVFLVVGTVHLAAWNFEFPTEGERWAWRACSIAISVSIPVAWVLARMFLWVTGFKGELGSFDRRVYVLAVCIQIVGVTLYVLARLYLLVEVFVGLRAMPRGVYATPDWTAFIPHVQ